MKHLIGLGIIVCSVLSILGFVVFMRGNNIGETIGIAMFAGGIYGTSVLGEKCYSKPRS